MVDNDDRRVVGARVHTKASFVTNMAECSRRYGSIAKTKRIGGTVVATELEPLPGKTRKSWWIAADCELGGDAIKCKKLDIRSVTTGDAPAADPSTVPTGTQPVTENTGIVDARGASCTENSEVPKLWQSINPLCFISISPVGKCITSTPRKV